MRAALLASLLILGLAPEAGASEVRNFFNPELKGQPIAACLAGGACGKAAADAFCKAEGYDHATIFQRMKAQQARTLDSGHECTGNCPSFRQVKCFTLKDHLDTAAAKAL